jgi:hypothetical protein
VVFLKKSLIFHGDLYIESRREVYRNGSEEKWFNILVVALDT